MQNDEYFTPEWVWGKLGKLLDSKFKKCLDPFFGIQKSLDGMKKQLPMEVICSPEIDFYTKMPKEDEYDCIISNIPFTGNKSQHW